MAAQTAFTFCTYEDGEDGEGEEASTHPPPIPLNVADVAQNCSTLPGYFFSVDFPYNDIVINPGEGKSGS